MREFRYGNKTPDPKLLTACLQLKNIPYIIRSYDVCSVDVGDGENTPSSREIQAIIANSLDIFLDQTLYSNSLVLG